MKNFKTGFCLFQKREMKRVWPFIWTNFQESPTPKDALCQVWLVLAQSFWRRRWKCEKFTDRQTDGRTDRQTTDDRWSEKLTWTFSSGELTKTIGHTQKKCLARQTFLKFYTFVKIMTLDLDPPCTPLGTQWVKFWTLVLRILVQNYNRPTLPKG